MPAAAAASGAPAAAVGALHTSSALLASILVKIPALGESISDGTVRLAARGGGWCAHVACTPAGRRPFDELSSPCRHLCLLQRMGKRRLSTAALRCLRARHVPANVAAGQPAQGEPTPPLLRRPTA